MERWNNGNEVIQKLHNLLQWKHIITLSRYTDLLMNAKTQFGTWREIGCGCSIVWLQSRKVLGKCQGIRWRLGYVWIRESLKENVEKKKEIKKREK